MNIPFRTALSWLLGCEYVRNDEAELISGRYLPWNPKNPAALRGHVGVTFESQDSTYLFETAAKMRERMIRSTMRRPSTGPSPA